MLTSHELLGFMSPALANDILSFIFESDKPAYKATLAAVAEAKHVRPIFLERQPRTERHTTMLSALTKPNLDAAAAAFIRAWLVKKHAAMLVDFLNALGIPHENRSEEHTSELQSPCNLVCRLLLEKKHKNNSIKRRIHRRCRVTVTHY